MAKLQDKFYNRVIEGDLELGAEDKIAPQAIASAIAGGDVDNAKPIYWHGIELYSTTGGLLYFHILNNSPEKINSKQKIIDWITSFSQKVLIECNGIIMDSGVKKTVYSIYKSENTSYLNMIIDNPDGLYEVRGDVDLETYFNTYNDEVNKIN